MSNHRKVQFTIKYFRNMLASLKDKIIQIDLFSQKVELYMKKEKDHKTTFGALCSMLLLFVILYYGIQLILTMVQRQSPSIQQFINYNPVPPLQYLTSENFTFVVGVQNGATFQYFINDSLYSLSMVALKKYSVSVNNSVQVLFDPVPIPLTVCSKSKIKMQSMKDYFQALDLTTVHCIDFDQIDTLVLEGAFDSPVYRYFQLSLSMCTNDTTNPSAVVCAPQEEIDASLSNINFAWQVNDIMVDVNDPYDPNKIIGKDSYTTASNAMNKKIDFYLKPLETQTDFGYVTTDIKTLTGVKYDSMNEFLQLQPIGRSFLQMQVRLQYQTIVYTRVYLKLQEILGTVGGLWQSLFIALLILVQPVNQLSQKLILLNSLFNFEGQDPDDITKMHYSESSRGNSRQDKRRKSQNMKKILSSIVSMKGQNKNKSQNPDEIAEDQEKASMQGSQHQSFYSDNKEKYKVISSEIKRYFKNTSKRIVLSCSDYCQIAFNCIRMSHNNQIKNDQIRFSDNRLEKSMDIINIIKKFNEIDKLKVLLLSPDQIKLFDYVEKPTIPIHPYNPNYMRQNYQYWSILKPEKTNYQAALEAQRAYSNVAQDFTNPTNVRLLQMLNPNVIKLFNSMDMESSSKPIESQKQESDCQFEVEDDERYQRGNVSDQRSIQMNAEQMVVSSPSIANKTQFYVLKTDKERPNDQFI